MGDGVLSRLGGVTWKLATLFLFLTPLVSAIEICVDVDVSAWTQAQRNARQAIAYVLANDVGGQNLHPHSPSGAQVTEVGNTQICFTDPLFDVPTVITTQTMLNQYAIMIANNQTDAATEAQRQAAFESEVTTNDLCTASLVEIENRIDTEVAALQAQLDATTTAAEVKAHLRNQFYPKLGAVFRKLGRCVRARAR